MPQQQQQSLLHRHSSLQDISYQNNSSSCVDDDICSYQQQQQQHYTTLHVESATAAANTLSSPTQYNSSSSSSSTLVTHLQHIITNIAYQRYTTTMLMLICSCLLSVMVGYLLGSSSNSTPSSASSSLYFSDTELSVSSSSSETNNWWYHNGGADPPLVSAKDLETSTIGPRNLSHPTTHITGVIEEVFEQYIPNIPTLFPVLRLAPTVSKRCTSEVPAVESDSDDSDTVEAHDSRLQEMLHKQQQQRQAAVNGEHVKHSSGDEDDEYEHGSEDEQNEQKEGSAMTLMNAGGRRRLLRYRHHSDGDDNDCKGCKSSSHHHHKHDDEHGRHSDHHIYHGHDDDAHHIHHRSDNDDHKKSETSNEDEAHQDHHHEARDDDHHHNKYIFKDPKPGHGAKALPPPAVRFHWCCNCTERCDNIVNAIDFMARTNRRRDRAMKLHEMAASLPRFFRGVDHLYLEDVYNLPYDSVYFTYSTARTRTFVSADQHLYNYGTYENSRDELVYDMNDFDQTLIDNYHIDLWRTATSLVIHMRINGIRIEEQRRILYDFASTYYTTVVSFVGNDNELYAYLHGNNTEGAVYETVFLAKYSNSRQKMLDKFCYYDQSGTRRLNDAEGSSASLEPVSHEEYDRIVHYWPTYLASLGQIHRQAMAAGNHTDWQGEWHRAGVSKKQYFNIKSVARRVGAGLGSLGVPRYYVLCDGPSAKDQDDDILLDVKFEPVPEWWNFVHDDVRAANGHFLSQGHRIATGIHALGSHVSSAVGWMDMDDGSFIVRPRTPYKAQVDVDALLSPIRFHSFAMHLAVVNAINHARADNDYNSMLIPSSFEEELVAIVGPHVDNFAAILTDYAFMNANRIAEDFGCFLRSGLVEKYDDQSDRAK